jgi:hypothetical protein
MNDAIKYHLLQGFLLDKIKPAPGFEAAFFGDGSDSSESPLSGRGMRYDWLSGVASIPDTG